MPTESTLGTLLREIYCLGLTSRRCQEMAVPQDARARCHGPRTQSDMDSFFLLLPTPYLSLPALSPISRF